MRLIGTLENEDEARRFTAYLKKKGIDVKRYELNSAVLCALTTPNVAEKWLDGQDVFRDCLIDRQPQTAPRPVAATRPR